MRAILVYLLFVIHINDIRSECPQWAPFNVSLHGHEEHLHKLHYYAYAIIPRPEHVNKKCIYMDVVKGDHKLYNTIYYSTDITTNKETVLNVEIKKKNADKEISDYTYVFDDPKVEKWEKLYLTDLTPHYIITNACIGDQMHPYAYTRKRKASQKILDEILNILASRGVTRDQLTFVDQDNCKN